jgi:hypothetical protein
MPLVDQDQEHLRLLSIVYYLYAGMSAFFGLFGLLYIVLGLVVAPMVPNVRNGDPGFPAYIFVVIGGIFIVLAAAVTTAELLVARYLKRRQHHTFCLIVAGLNCLWIPFGTALVVFTILVLQRAAVNAMFDGTPKVYPPEPPALPSI